MQTANTRRNAPVTISVKIAAHTLGIGKTKLYELLNAGTIRSFSIGRRRLIVAEDIQTFVESATAR